ncbi:hypothetical protein B566_EDAN017467 [Ephemera danica]|nr:hypothetical protein B566_EDAN017467 [Ephemera danica]
MPRGRSSQVGRRSERLRTVATVESEQPQNLENVIEPVENDLTVNDVVQMIDEEKVAGQQGFDHLTQLITNLTSIVTAANPSVPTLSVPQGQNSEQLCIVVHQPNARSNESSTQEPSEQSVAKAKDRQARNYNKNRRFVAYKPGDLVLKREHHLSNAEKKFSGKLADRWGGPYKVISVHNGVTLVVGDMVNEAKRHTVHVCDVRPFVERRSDLQYTSEAEVADPTAVEDESEEEPRHRMNELHCSFPSSTSGDEKPEGGSVANMTRPLFHKKDERYSSTSRRGRIRLVRFLDETRFDVL